MFPRLKAIFLPSGLRPSRVVAGLNRGLMMHLDLHHDLQRLFGVYEREIAPLVKKCGCEINSAIDVGANDGYYTLYFLCKTPAKSVFSFEPSISATQLLLSNLRLNGLENDSRLVLSPMSVGAQDAGKATSLDSACSAVRGPCLIKVDVEGGEADILAGAERLLRRAIVFLLIETHSLPLENQCVSRLSAMGYETMVVRNAWWRRMVPERRLLAHNRWLFAWKDPRAALQPLSHVEVGMP